MFKETIILIKYLIKQKKLKTNTLQFTTLVESF